MGGERRYTADVKSEFLLDNYRSVRSWWNEPVRWTVDGNKLVNGPAAGSKRSVGA